MKRAAFFVEGQTELIFTKKLLSEIAGEKNIVFDVEQWTAKTFVTLQSPVVAGQSYYALIVDCRSDGAVVSAIRSRHASLAAAGYDLVVGLRDLYPLGIGDLQALKTGVASVIPVGAPTCHVSIAVAEVEAWFMQEDTHFVKIDAACTPAAILAKTGFDVVNDLAESLAQPSKTLNAAYKIGGKAYNKKAKNVSRTVDALDYEHLYLELRAVLSSFDEFAGHIDSFLS